jgi:DNA polymerase III delta prime subunit
VSLFKPATRSQTKARVLLAGPSGSGKTRAALEIAHGLGARIAVIDTENRSASLYVGLNGITFDVCELQPPYSYQKYLEAMTACFGARAYDVLVIDSLTHVWSGEGGALETVDRKANGGNAFTAWKDVTPQHNRLLTALSSSPIHLLCTVRTKTSYVLEERENRQGRLVSTPRKVGMAPIFREGVEYEFSVQLDINLDHEVTVSKTRITELDGTRFAPSELTRIGEVMRSFHDTGTVPSNVPGARPAQPPASPLPTKTSKSYSLKQWAEVPFSSLPHSALTDYIAYYVERLPTLKQANHIRAVEQTIAAAEAELARRTDAEAAGADPETGEVPEDHEQDPPFPDEAGASA